MATSSKVVFDLTTLRTKALESLDGRLSSARLHLESFDDDEAQAIEVAQWRVKQEDRIRELAKRIDTAAGIPDAELAAFKVQPIPEVDQWTRREAVRTVRDLEALRTQVLAKSEALVPNEDGTIALTKTQLAEFFGL